MVRSIKIGAVLTLVFLANTIYGQFGIGGGPSFMFEFGNPKPFYGLHIVGEKPRNNEVTFYGRLTYLFNQNSKTNLGQLTAFANDQATNPSFVPVDLNQLTSINYFMIDGGTRYYLINGFDEGFSLYGGTNIALIVNSVKHGYQFGDYDESKYTLESGDFTDGREKGTIIRLAVGFTGGVKYTISAKGTFFFDINPQLTLFGIPSNQNIPSSVYRSVFFNFNIGYRKEIF